MIFGRMKRRVKVLSVLGSLKSKKVVTLVTETFQPILGLLAAPPPTAICPAFQPTSFSSILISSTRAVAQSARTRFGSEGRYLVL